MLAPDSVVMAGAPVPLLPRTPAPGEFAAAPARQPAPWRTPERVSETQEPDIHVSIGRIEIRTAATERRPQPARAARPQLMSLEDYLARGRPKGRP
jgi:hypothetical protein